MEDPAPEPPRGRKHPLDDDAPSTGGAKRSRSAESGYSSSSVSTISTAISRSPTPHPRDEYMTSQNLHMSGATLLGDAPPLPPPNRLGRKRRRSSSEDDEDEDEGGSSEVERNTRRRHNVSSPHERGRASERERGAGGRHRGDDGDRGGDGPREPLSPSPRARRRNDGERRRSRSRSPYRREQRGRASDGRRVEPEQQQQHRQTFPPRKRSMSPYSKRLALTAAMGRQ
jgi:hypothetical protein